MSNYGDDLQQLWEPLCDREAEYGFDALTEAEQNFACVWMLLGEVNNGGFHQFFYNSAGDQAAITVLALETVGARHTANLMKQANSCFPGDGPPADWIARREIIEGFSDDVVERLDALDEEFYKEEDDLESLLYQFVMNNQNQFNTHN